MALLNVWRGDNYRCDLDMGAGYHLNQSSSMLHSVPIGDSLWAFTRNRNGDYVMAAELVISAKTRNPPTFRYGGYRVWGDLKASRYFGADEQQSVEPLIRSLSCGPKADVLGRSFQGRSAVRTLTQADHALLRRYTATLPLEPRARLLPEDDLEQALDTGSAAEVQRLIQHTPNGLARARMEYLYSKAPTRSRRLATDLHELYAGRCQICLRNPCEKYGAHLCEGHHIQWLSRGGDDRLDNMVLVCPNHHTAIHKCDAVFDYADMSFIFPKYRGVLQINSHIETRSAIVNRQSPA